MNTKFWFQTLGLRAIAGGLAFTTFAAEPAQPGASQPAPAATAPTPTPPDYFLPDLPSGSLIRDLTFKPIIAIVTDYTAFKQDDASLSQVGQQDDTADLRAFRIGAILRSKGALKWVFTVTTDY